MSVTPETLARLAALAETLMPPGTDRLVPIRVVCHMTALSRSSIYAAVKSGTFPAPVKLGPKRVAWKTSDVHQWMNARSNVWSA